MNLSRKIAYAATVAALGAAALVAAFYLQMLTPYVVCGLGVGFIIKRCGPAYGFLTYIAIGILGLLIGIGIGLTAVMPFILLFGPHPILGFFLERLKIERAYLKYAARYAVLLVFFNLAFAGVYFLFSVAVMNLTVIEAWLGGYALLAIVGSVVFILYDVAFVLISKAAEKRIK